ncbi:hypothetical protein [Luteolibacter soli]|uniref:Uncharacterized protein n=1 Tax=Luteolibacter soli TaxID=3135280 RepID=A0ABU9B317_9BACT
MTTTLFLLFVAAMAVVTGWLIWRSLSNRFAIIATVALAAWLAYVGLIGHAGVIRNTDMKLPGVVFLFVPVLLFLAVFVVRTLGGNLVAVPLTVLMALQSSRVIVELFIHQLWLDGIVPRMLTYSGANVDIYVGATALIVAWLSSHWERGRQLAVIWNLLGLLALANVVVRAVLTAPGPLHLIHAEVPNLMIGTFPYMFIPGLFVPLAVVLHVSALRAAIAKGSRATTSAT